MFNDFFLQELCRTPLFVGLSIVECAEILQDARRQSFAVDAYVFHQRRSAEQMFILLEGQIKVVQLTPEGQQVVMRLVNPLEIFGCIAALSGGEYPASGLATKPCEVLLLPKDQVHAQMTRFPQLAINAFQIMVKRTHELQDRFRELATENVEKRLAHTLLRLKEQNGVKQGSKIFLDLPLSRQDLAEMVGTTLYTVSRILSAWEQKGWIEAGREKLSLIQPDALARLIDAF